MKIQVTVTKSGSITNQADFPSMEEAQAWVSSHEGMGSFGSPAIYQDQQVLISEEVRGEVQVLETEATFDEFGEELTPATYTIDPDGIIEEAVYETQTQLVRAADYTVEIQDITAQVEQEAINVAALAYLASTDWMIIRESEGGTACSEEIKDARASARASIVR